MSLKFVLGTMLASRMGGRGRRGGGLGSAAMLGGLGMLGGRRGGLGRKAGLAALGYMAYRAYQDKDRGAAAAGSSDRGGSEGGITGMIGDLANRLGLGEDGQSGTQEGPTPEDREAAEAFSDDKALLLIRAMITAANSDGVISTEERARIMQHLDEAGADSEDRRTVEREIEAPKSLDELIGQVNDPETAQEFYLASRAAVEGATEPQRAYLAYLRQRLKLSEEDAAEIEVLTA